MADGKQYRLAIIIDTILKAAGIRQAKGEVEGLTKATTQASESQRSWHQSFFQSGTLLQKFRNAIGPVTASLTGGFALGLKMVQAAGIDTAPTISLLKDIFAGFSKVVVGIVGGPFKSFGEAMFGNAHLTEQFSGVLRRHEGRVVGLLEAVRDLRARGWDASLESARAHQKVLQGIADAAYDAAKAEQALVDAQVKSAQHAVKMDEVGAEGALLNALRDKLANLKAQQAPLEAIRDIEEQIHAIEKKSIETWNSEQRKAEEERIAKAKAAAAAYKEQVNEFAKLLAAGEAHMQVILERGVHIGLVQKQTQDKLLQDAKKNGKEVLEQILKEVETTEEGERRKQAARAATTRQAIQDTLAILSATSSLFQSIANYEKAESDAKIARLERRRDAEIKAAEAIGASTAAIDKKYAALIEKEKKKAFERNKKYQLAMADINAAAAIVSIWANSGNPYVAAALTVLVAAENEIQKSIIRKSKYVASAEGGWDRTTAGMHELHDEEVVVSKPGAPLVRQLGEHAPDLSRSLKAILDERGSPAGARPVEAAGSMWRERSAAMVAAPAPAAVPEVTKRGRRYRILETDDPEFISDVRRGSASYDRNIENRNTRGGL